MDYAAPRRSIERPLVKLVAHASPHALEAELLDRVAAAKIDDPFAPVLIVVPSRRLADHVDRRLVERLGAVLGVSVLHHRALAQRVLAHAGAAPAPILSEDLLDALFARVVQRAAAGPMRDFVRDHPSAATALRGSLTDLREAGIRPEQATALLRSSDPEVAALYARWAAALEEIGRGGAAIDDAGLTVAAASTAGAYASRFAAILHHGAYDLIGVRVDLVRALDRGRELTFLLPGDPQDAAGVFGRERARAISDRRGDIAPLDREAPRAPVMATHAQGAAAEIRAAAYEALAAVARGVRPHEVAIIARTFGPYTGALDALLDRGEPPWHTSYARPLRGDPATSAALAAIAAASDGGPATWGGHADRLGDVAGSAAPEHRLSGLFAAMQGLATLLGDERSVSHGEALSWLAARADAATLSPDGAEGGGIRILDAMQARGMTFSEVGLVGMNSGVFPRVPREDPFLPDASRLRLRGATGRPLPVAAESGGEERLLLSMTLGSASRRLRVSWLRSDEEARPKVPSLALRDVAAFAGLPSDAEALQRTARPLPAHPRSRLEALARVPGLLDRRDESLLAALASEAGADAGPAIAERRPELRPGIALVGATESFAPTDGKYDGRIGVAFFFGGPIAATALERLGLCPLQFFFRDVLGIGATVVPPTPFEADAASVGRRVHEVLRDVYARLREEDAFRRTDVEARIARARMLLRASWKAASGENEPARLPRLPLLRRIEETTWMAALDAFLEADLRRMETEGLAPEELEHEVEKPMPGGPDGLVVRARLDRILRGPSDTVVGDYKTGGDLAERVQPARMVSGAELQVPVYSLLTDAPVDVLGVGLRHDTAYLRFRGFKTSEQHDGFLETVRVAAALAAAGRFPIRSGTHCSRCDYRDACRRGHPPTEYRERLAPDARDARDCWQKTANAPTLAAIRAGTGR